jgi:hypothetical protein
MYALCKSIPMYLEPTSVNLAACVSNEINEQKFVLKRILN